MGKLTMTPGAVSTGQSGDEFRQAIAASPVDTDTLDYLVTNILYARGSLPKDVRRDAVKAIKSYAVIVDVSRDPQGVLAIRSVEPIPNSQEPTNG